MSRTNSFLTVLSLWVAMLRQGFCWAGTTVDAPAAAAAFAAQADLPTAEAQLRAWAQLPVEDRLAILDALATYLPSDRVVPMRRTEGVVIPGREDRDRIGHGVMLSQDVFLVGGKAA